MEELPQGRLADPKAMNMPQAIDNLMQGNVSLVVNQANDECLIRIKPRTLWMALAARLKTAYLAPFTMPDNRCRNPD